jgi:hypothetical protein
MMMEALIDAGVHMGFPRRIAEEIVLQTVSGSVAFARSSGKHMAELRNMVTSPGGTSAEAIYQMEKGGLRTVLSKSVYAAFQRTQSLAAEQTKKSGGGWFHIGNQASVPGISCRNHPFSDEFVERQAFQTEYEKISDTAIANT